MATLNSLSRFNSGVCPKKSKEPEMFRREPKNDANILLKTLEAQDRLCGSYTVTHIRIRLKRRPQGMIKRRPQEMIKRRPQGIIKNGNRQYNFRAVVSRVSSYVGHSVARSVHTEYSQKSKGSHCTNRILLF